jgi:hypothetical protein
MNRLILVISALVVSSLALASSSSAVDYAGTYVLRVSEESAALCRLMQTPVPESKVVLTQDAQYRIERSVKGQLIRNDGSFAVERGVLILYGKKPVKATVVNDSLILDGLVYQREAYCPMVGTWVVRQANGFVDTQSKFTFSEKGTFRYKGLGGTSSGTYEVDEGCIYLTYKEVDGERVAEPFRGRAFRVADGFRIDRYRFVRA